MEFENMNVFDLQLFCRVNDIRGFSRMTRIELIAYLSLLNLKRRRIYELRIHGPTAEAKKNDDNDDDNDEIINDW